MRVGELLAAKYYLPARYNTGVRKLCFRSAKVLLLHSKTLNFLTLSGRETGSYRRLRRKVGISRSSWYEGCALNSGGFTLAGGVDGAAFTLTNSDGRSTGI